MHPRLSWLLALILMAGVVIEWHGPPLGSAQAAPQAAPSPTCYAWDFYNNTGHDATGLVANLSGVLAISDVYTGPFNPFGAPSPSSGYDPATGVYTLIFSNGTAYAGTLARIGICTDSPIFHLAGVSPAIYWVLQGLPLADAPLFVGMETTWFGPNQLQVRLYNEQSTPLTLFSLTASLPPDILALDDLNDEVVSGLPLVNDAISDPLELAGGGMASFTILFNETGVTLVSGQPVILEAALSTDADPGDTITLVAEVSPPAAQVYLPVVAR